MKISSKPSVRMLIMKPQSSPSDRTKEEASSIFLSAFYGKFLVILGIALPVTNAVIDASPRKIDGYYIFLNIISTLFLIYFYCMYVRRHKYMKCNEVDGKSLFSNGGEHIQPGSFYLYLGVIMFGCISVIFYCLQFGQYIELNEICRDPLMAVMPLTRIIFIVQQMMFIISWSQHLKQSGPLLLTRWGLMHLIATNLCIWFRVIIEETDFEIFNAHQKNSMRPNDTMNTSFNQNMVSDIYKFSWEYDGNVTECFNSNIMKPLLRNANPYLSPCAVEYSLLCTVILVTMWKNICLIPSTNQESNKLIKCEVSNPQFTIANKQEPMKFYLDCENAQKGLILSLIIFIGTVISLVMFFELVNLPDYSETAISQVNICEMTLYIISAMTSVIMLTTIKKFGKHQVRSTNSRHTDHLLLFLTQFGVYFYSLFQVIGYYFLIIEKSMNYKWIRIAPPMFAVVQSSCQTLLIIEAWRQHCNFEKNIKQKFFRQLITFLIMSNISLWIINRVKNNRAEFHPLQMEFYGVWTWTIITHIANPMVICYRFQSTVCFYEMWKILNEFYEIEKRQKSCEEIVKTNV